MVSAPLTWTTVWVLCSEPLFTILFSLHTDSRTACHRRLLMYVDGFVVGNSYSKCSDQEGPGNDLFHLPTDHVLIMDKTTCVECFFYSEKNKSSQLPLSFLNAKVLSHERTANYLGAYFFSCMTWFIHTLNVFTQCFNLSLFAYSFLWSSTGLSYGEVFHPMPSLQCYIASPLVPKSLRLTSNSRSQLQHVNACKHIPWSTTNDPILFSIASSSTLSCKCFDFLEH